MAHLGDHADDARPRALLLDGDRASRARLRALLEAAGWRADPAAGDADAVRRRGIGPARVVFADWPRLEPLWPDLLAAREAGEGSPYLVALIAPEDGDQAAGALDAGADDCLLHPVRPGDLTARLAVALRTGRVRRGMRGAVAAATRERERAAAVLSSLPDGLVIMAPDGTVVEVNDALCLLLGVPRDELVGRRSLFPEWPEEERPRLSAALVQAGRDGAAERDVMLPRADGTRFPALVSIAVSRPGSGRPGVYVATVKDMTDRLRAEAVRAAVGRVGAVADAAGDSAVVFARIAREVAALAGGAHGAVHRGAGATAMVVTASDGAEPGSAPAALPGALRAPVEVDGAPWGHVVAAPAPGRVLPAGLGEVLESMADVAAGAVIAERARRLVAARAGADPLTGLPGPQAFAAELAREVERVRRYGGPLSLVLVDVDGFRRVNDRDGARAADAVLRGIGELLSAHVRAGDALGRTGGDEFAWLLPHAGPDDARDAAARLRRAIAETPFPGVGYVTTSVGIATAASADGTADLHRQAEVALHWAKVSGRNRAMAYSFAVAEEVFAHRGGDRAEAPSLRAMRALAWAVDAKDPYTHRHSARVADLAVQIATALGWPVTRSAQLREAGLVHDVGKIAVPDAILFKPGPLTEEERDAVAAHAAVGARIVADVLSAEQAAWVRGHHERWDGAGYPDRLAGEEIPEEARVLALADSWDVIVSSRSYQAGRGVEAALAEVRRCAGSQFWPVAVDALARLVAAGAVTGGDAEAATPGSPPSGRRAPGSATGGGSSPAPAAAPAGTPAGSRAG
ncbi:MAG TPA: HD domain-containing phosphohydrolase [Miltoncostaea sp.]|nr:HD domain-containing phosphohydrolase [Miltoncostaea sp.]